jgi:pimeloyl-ACP methyl ester carboxylesterase
MMVSGSIPEDPKRRIKGLCRDEAPDVSMKLKKAILIIGLVLLGLILVDGAVRITGFLSVVSTGLTIHTSPEARIVDAPGEVSFGYTALGPLTCATSCDAVLIRHDTNEVIARSELKALSSGTISAFIDDESSLKRVPVQIVLTCSAKQTRYCSIDEQVSVDLAIVRFDLDEEQHKIRNRIVQAREELETALPENQALLDSLVTLEEPYESISTLAKAQQERYARESERFLEKIREESYRMPPDEPDAISAWRDEQAAYPDALELNEHVAERFTILRPYRSRFENRENFEDLMVRYLEMNVSATHALDTLTSMNATLERISSINHGAIISASSNSAHATNHQLETACAIHLTPCPAKILKPETISEAYELNRAQCELARAYHKDQRSELLGGLNLTLEEAYEAYNTSALRSEPSFRQLERDVLSNLSLAENLTFEERLAIRVPVGASYCEEPIEPIMIELPTIDVEPEAIDITILGERTCALGSCEPEASAPILFIHGHSFASSTDPRYNLQGMTRIAHAFETYGYLYAGHLFPTTTKSIERIDAPVSFTATYYVNSYEEEGAVTISTFKSEPIESYAIRLREDIEEAKRITGSDTVILVAHSMGGLVARSYLDLFGEDSVERLIMIGTPNNGIVDRTERLCPLLGSSLECRDMTRGSVFLRRLNARTLPDIPIAIIAGTGCEESDGVVELEHALLEGAQTTIINGTCSGIETLHSALIDPRQTPETLVIIARTLGR